MRKVDVGCGCCCKPGYIGVDIKACGQQYVRDIQQGLPFDDNSVDEIFCQNVLEHISNLLFVMEEFYRVLKPCALLEIIVPHYTSPNAWKDPTHIRSFNEFSMDYYIPGVINVKAKEGKALFQKQEQSFDNNNKAIHWKLLKI
jgi:ubiquinone/menaquinone biosynthesis C-methylase UbiE